jgi:hypothetical protein
MNDSIITALIAFLGVIAGAGTTILVEWLRFRLQENAQKEQDKKRSDLLRKMLMSLKYKWRKLETLMHVVGADEECTKRLLIALGARASEDGSRLWGLIERNPLPEATE